MIATQENISDLRRSISWARLNLELAKEELQDWKPTAVDYEDKICQMLDRMYQIPECGLMEFDAQDYTVTQIMRRLNVDALDRLVEEFFQKNYDALTEADYYELTSNVSYCESKLLRLEDELVDALDRRNESED